MSASGRMAVGPPPGHEAKTPGEEPSGRFLRRHRLLSDRWSGTGTREGLPGGHATIQIGFSRELPLASVKSFFQMNLLIHANIAEPLIGPMDPAFFRREEAGRSLGAGRSKPYAGFPFLIMRPRKPGLQRALSCLIEIHLVPPVDFEDLAAT